MERKTRRIIYCLIFTFLGFSICPKSYGDESFAAGGESRNNILGDSIADNIYVIKTENGAFCFAMPFQADERKSFTFSISAKPLYWATTTSSTYMLFEDSELIYIDTWGNIIEDEKNICYLDIGQSNMGPEGYYDWHMDYLEEETNFYFGKAENWKKIYETLSFLNSQNQTSDRLCFRITMAGNITFCFLNIKPENVPSYLSIIESLEFVDFMRPEIRKQ